MAGVQSIAAYQLAKLSASNAAAPLSWQVYQLTPVGSYTAGADFVFTAPPGSYLVVLQAGNGSSTWQIQFTPPGNLPNPGPVTPDPPKPQPGPVTPPQPEPIDGFVYPPDAAGFVGSVSQAVKATRFRPEEVFAMSKLYRLTADTIALDGLRSSPKHKTIADAMALTKANEDELVKTSKVRPIKVAFPEASKLAATELSQVNPSDQLTPENRAAYVDFLNRLALGFDQGRPQ